MTLAQLIQSGPAKANELFAKLADTSDGAVKTREKLLADLKEELEVQSQLEERHLFPVLRKHKETKDLVQEAINDNREAKALLAELEKMPKEGEDFARKLAELRKVFQQHVRDERKELLPAVRKALSDEEAQAVTEKIEAGRARIEDAKREEAEQRRAEARREREAVEAMARPAERIIRAESRMVETGAATANAGIDATRQGLRHAAGMASRTVSQTAPPVMEQFQALAAVPTVAARTAGEAGAVWMEYVNRTTRAGAEAFARLARCSGPQQVAEEQRRFLNEASRAWMDVGSRMLDLTMRASTDVLRSGERR
ncbi:MAG TPA: hemerythrin domain-containing protein [Azospirillum sp.]|nr:hemerythrin domain-containing protein [Azospirillum sp.]